MPRAAVVLLLLLTSVGSTLWFFHHSSSQPDPAQIERLQSLIKTLAPLHERPGEPRAGDWRLQHLEPGQSFRQYVTSKPVTPQGRRNLIYIQPIGELNESQRAIISSTADFMRCYFDRTVKVQDPLPLAVIPNQARRTHPRWGMNQVLSTYVLNSVLKPHLPRDAAALVAFTTSDLWPGGHWNFVFGQASLNDRVGVWSIYRNGDSDPNSAEFPLCLRRTLRTATHETGHMFSLHHCTLYRCNMAGSNNREESDQHPLEVCPECLAKICWATQADPANRFRRLIEFCQLHQLDPEREFYQKSLAALNAAAPLP